MRAMPQAPVSRAFAPQAPVSPSGPVRSLRWSIVCQVVDNWGDLGVCWRLACNLAERGQQVRLWVDDPSPLRWMAPQGNPKVQVRQWPQREGDAPVSDVGDVLIEAFGTENATDLIAACAINTRAIGHFGLENEASTPSKPLWINLEYLSAESYVERSHQLPSPILHGPATGRTRWFFYPGFTPRTGGLLRESDLQERQAAFSRDAWLAIMGLPPVREDETLISLFCYESPALAALLAQLARAPKPSRLLVTHGRTAQAVKTVLNSESLSQIGLQPAYSLHKQLSNSEQNDAVQIGALSLHLLPALTQTDYDHLLWACDFNIVRGEDSLVRALWAGKPFIWHIYPQSDGAHAPKLQALLDWLQAPTDWRQAWLAFNGLSDRPLQQIEQSAWSVAASQAQQRLCAQADLASQLIAFAQQKLGLA
jgi:uncharacterized repeat protein (TIGR03837 family)